MIYLSCWKKIRADYDSWRSVKDANVLYWLIARMTDYLNDKVSNITTYSDLLYTGVFSLSADGFPEIDVSLSEIKYYELWRNALRHIVAEPKSIDEITSEILESEKETPLKDNLRQLEMLGKLTGIDDDAFHVTEHQKKEAREHAEIKTEEFKNNLELAYTYYQISETEKENLFGIMKQYKDSFYDICDFACWRNFLEALKKQIQEFSDIRKKELMEINRNFSVTEEYLNRYESGEREFDQTVQVDNDYFNDFLSSDVFDPLYKECQNGKGRSLKSFGVSYLEKKFPEEWTSRLRESSRNLVLSWPTKKNTSR